MESCNRILLIHFNHSYLEMLWHWQLSNAEQHVFYFKNVLAREYLVSDSIKWIDAKSMTNMKTKCFHHEQNAMWGSLTWQGLVKGGLPAYEWTLIQMVTQRLILQGILNSRTKWMLHWEAVSRQINNAQKDNCFSWWILITVWGFREIERYFFFFFHIHKK